MIRKINRIFQDFLRPKRLALGKKIWDKKEKKYSNLIESGKVNMKNVNSILFLRYDGKIGDMIINTLMFKEIKKYYPNIKIGVVARGGAKEIIKYNKNIDEVYDYEKGKEKELSQKISKDKYDILIDFSEVLRVNQMKFINLCNAKINIGLNKKGWNLFDISYEKIKGKHISDLYREVLSILNIDNPNLDYDIEIPESIEMKVQKLLKNNEDIIVINPYAASKHRSLKKERVVEICKKVNEKMTGKIYIIGENSKEIEIKEIITDINNEAKYIKLDGILEVASLIKKAKFIISPDTSIIHIASAFKKPLIGIYRKDRDDENSKIWAPNYPQGKQIFSEDNSKKIGEETDINLFNIKDLEKELIV